jgi:hypothetical protein
LKLFLRYLPSVEATHLLDDLEESAFSPLCAAAYSGRKDIAELLLAAGAKLDLTGSVHGTPLLVAARLGRLEVVKLLVRRVASLEYTDGEGVRHDIFEAAALHKRVLRWLLVGRFTDQPRLGDSPEGVVDGTEYGPLAGIRQMILDLGRDYRRRGIESMLRTHLLYIRQSTKNKTTMAILRCSVRLIRIKVQSFAQRFSP